MHIQESTTPFAGSPLDDFGANNGLNFQPDVYTANPIRDRIWRNQPPNAPDGSGSGGGLNAILAQLSSLLQQLMSALSGGMQNFFTNAQASSTGDPHLAFNGTNSNGDQQQARFDSMAGHSDLLDSNSVRGGYRLSTGVTDPGANGVTYNRTAAVTTNYGRTQVSLDNAGNAQVCRNGKTASIAAGQSMQLGPNEKVTRNADGSVVVAETGQDGGTITTTLRDNGPGVDVNVDANDVALSGDLVQHK